MIEKIPKIVSLLSQSRSEYITWEKKERKNVDVLIKNMRIEFLGRVAPFEMC